MVRFVPTMSQFILDPSVCSPYRVSGSSPGRRAELHWRFRLIHPPQNLANGLLVVDTVLHGPIPLLARMHHPSIEWLEREGGAMRLGRIAANGIFRLQSRFVLSWWPTGIISH